MHCNAKDYQSKIWKPIAKKYKQIKTTHQNIHRTKHWKNLMSSKTKQLLTILANFSPHRQNVNKKKPYSDKKKNKNQSNSDQISFRILLQTSRKISTRENFDLKREVQMKQSYFQLPTQLYPSIQWCKTAALTNLLH